MGRAATPMMEQYFRIKEGYKDCILLYRMGDFYEMFGEDAIIGSKELDITLTSRERGKKERIPLCGVPWHALDSYLPKLLAKGYKVAIAEQLEDPKTAKGLVDRDVVRIVTPGTVLESTVLESKANSYLMSIAEGEQSYGLSFVDIATGEFIVTEVDGADADLKVLSEFAQRSPKEVLHARDEPLKIPHRDKDSSDVAPGGSVRNQLFDRVKPAVYRAHLHERLRQPFSEQSRAHGGVRAIQDGDECVL